MRALLTGSSGFVGHGIAEALLARGLDVVATSRHATPDSRLAQAICADLGDAGWCDVLLNATPRCDYIVHAGASLAKGLDARSISLTNCLGMQNVVSLASTWGVQGLIFISSVPVIGVPVNLPITEDHPILPLTAYHASKLFGEYLVAAFAREHAGFGISLRLTAPVGPMIPDGRIVTNFVRRALRGEPLVLHGTGGRCQNYVHVADVGSAVAGCLDHTVSGVLNIAGPTAISDLELARLCVATAGTTAPIQFSGQPDPQESIHWLVSIERARHAINYNPSYPIERSIAELIELYARRLHQ